MTITRFQHVLNYFGFKKSDEQKDFLNLLHRHQFFSEMHLNYLDENNIRDILNCQVPSLKSAIASLYHFSECRFLRPTFYEEDKQADLINRTINLKRWGIENEYTPTAAASNTIWPSYTVQQVVLFSSIESVLRNRINLIPHLQADLYCLTGPRGLFNFEHSLSEILCKWFNLPEKLAAIQQVLTAHQQADDNLQWTGNLVALKSEILLTLGVSKWPQAPDSYYYQNKAEYDNYAQQCGHQPLDCLGGPWPVALDLINHLMQQRDNQGVKLIPIVVCGSTKRLAGIEEELLAWYERFGRRLLDQNKAVVFIVSGQRYTLKIIENHLSLQAAFRPYTSLSKLEKHLASFANKIHTFRPLWTVMSSIDGVQNHHQEADELAKIIYLRYRYLKAILPYHLVAEQYSKKLSIKYIENMLIAYRTKNFLDHAFYACQLALIYADHRPIQAIGLLNYIENILKYEHVHHQNIYYYLYESLIKLVHLFAQLEYKKHGINIQLTTDTILLKKIHRNRQLLFKIRKTLNDKLLQMNPHNEEEIKKFYNDGFYRMQNFIHNLLNEAETMVRTVEPLKYALVFFGSYAHVQNTPYSDIESFALTADDEQTFQF